MKVTVKTEYDVDVPDAHFDSVEELQAYVEAAPEWVLDGPMVDGWDRIEIIERTG